MTAAMTRVEFDANWTDIAAQLRAMRASNASRRRFRVLAIYSEDSSELVCEVMRTSLGPVVCFDSPMRGRPTVEPLTDDNRQMFWLASQVGQYPISAGKLRDHIAQGVQKMTIEFVADDTLNSAAD
jgi:hypothetical protein